MPVYLPEIITNYKAVLAYDLDDFTSASQTPTDTQAVARLNQAKDIVSTALFQTDYSIALTLTATSDASTPYDLQDLSVVSRRVLKPFEVVINGNILRDSIREFGLWSMSELQRRHPGWRTDGAGTPFIAAYAGSTGLYLYPAPTSAIVSAGQNYVSGQYLADDFCVPTTVTSGTASATQTLGSTAGMRAGQKIYFATAGVERTISSVTNSTTVVLTATVTTTTSEVASVVPDIPNKVRPALWYLAAIISTEPFISEQEQMARVGSFDKRVLQSIQDIAVDNQNAMIDIGTLGGFTKYVR